MVILEERPHFIGYLSKEAPFYLVNLRGGWWIFLFMCKTMLEVGWSGAGVSFYGPMLYLEGWSSRLSYFIGVAEQKGTYIE